MAQPIQMQPVYIQQPQDQFYTGSFKHGLCQCCDSCSDCLLSYFCGPCYSWCAAEAAGEGSCMGFLNCIFYPWCLCCLRQKVRSHKNIDGSCCVDLCITQLCPCCAAIQIKREYD